MAKMQNDEKQQTVTSPIEPAFSAATVYDGSIAYLTFDGVFLRKVKTKVGSRKIRSQMVRITRTINFAR